MRKDSPAWQQLGPPAQEHEAAALQTIRGMLPENDCYAWANVEYIDAEGPKESDLILLGPFGFLLVELKGWHGRLVGKQDRWERFGRNGPLPVDGSALNTTHKKAQKLKSALTAELRRSKRQQNIWLPRLEAVVVFHGEGLEVDVEPHTNLFALDGYRVKGLPVFSEVIKGLGGFQPLNPSTIDSTRALMESIGLRGRPKVRAVGQYVLTDREPVASGPGWEDYIVAHPAMPAERRRVRSYHLPPKAGQAKRQAVERAAMREYGLTRDLQHPGICAAVEFIAEPPAVVFPSDKHEVPLSQWLVEKGSQLTLDQRIGLISELTDAVRHAHTQGVMHRALSPNAVFMHTARGREVPKIRNWSTGQGEVEEGATSVPTYLHGPTEVAGVLDDSAQIYLAPEVLRGIADGVESDIFGLGALAYLILTGEAPAADLVSRDDKLRLGGLDPADAVPQLPGPLRELVQLATDPDVAARPSSVEEFRSLLNDAALARGNGEADFDAPRATDPLDAIAGDVLDDAWLVERVLGSGSTGHALVVSHADQPDRQVVLKVARDEEDASARLQQEAEVLATLDHPLIVGLREANLTVGGRTCIVMDYAGETTLGQHLREYGRLTLEQLQTWSADLLDIAAYLESQRVFHRDIKPDNLAARPVRSSTGGDRANRLTIFDFSQARTPWNDIKTGTRRYLDPFLGPAFKRPAYDSAAERFAVAVTLFEMATGTPPVWGDGQSAPDLNTNMHVDARPEMFDGPAAVAMSEFFTRALARDASERFGDLDEMARAWHRLFGQTSVTEIGPPASQEDLDRAAEAAHETTPLAEAGLSAQAVSAAQKLGAETVADLLAISGLTINQARGVGRRTRDELNQRRKQWAEALRSTTVETEIAPGRAVDVLRASLVLGATSANRAALALSKEFAFADGWPPLAALADLAGVDRAELPVAMEHLRGKWASREWLVELAAEVAIYLRSVGAVATADEVAAALVARRGSNLVEHSERIAAAMPLVRAVAEAWDQVPGSSEIALNRDPDAPDAPILIALVADEGGVAGVDGFADAEAAASALSAIRSLGAAADDATAAGDGLLGAHDSAMRMAPVAAEHGVGESRLVRLAAACSTASAASTRGELYRRGLPAAVTVPRVLMGAGQTVALKTVQERVARRYPQAAPLPPRPQLDALVADAVPGLRWDGANYARATSALPPSSTRFTAMFGGQADAEDITAARRRLQASLDTHSGMVLAVDPRLHDSAVAVLAEEFSVVPVNLAAELISAAKARAAEVGADWAFIRRMDAEATGMDRTRLLQFMESSLERFWPGLMARAEPLLLTDAAVLARYGLQDRLAAITNLAQPKPAARWVLVPHRSANAVPNLDGVAVPLGADGWLGLPAAMVRAEGFRAAG